MVKIFLFVCSIVQRVKESYEIITGIKRILVSESLDVLVVFYTINNIVFTCVRFIIL